MNYREKQFLKKSFDKLFLIAREKRKKMKSLVNYSMTLLSSIKPFPFHDFSHLIGHDDTTRGRKIHFSSPGGLFDVFPGNQEANFLQMRGPSTNFYQRRVLGAFAACERYKISKCLRVWIRPALALCDQIVM